MNILTAKLVEEVVIDGKSYKLNTDYRAALLTMLAFESAELLPQEKTAIMLKNLYPLVPDNLEAAIAQATIFLNGGNQVKAESDEKPRVFSFEKDNRYIFAAFRQTHGINLQEVDMHWHIFLALFMDLGADTMFCNIVSLRNRLISGKATKEERQLAQSLGEVFKLPEKDTSTLEEREREKRFLELVDLGKRRRNAP